MGVTVACFPERISKELGFSFLFDALRKGSLIVCRLPAHGGIKGQKRVKPGNAAGRSWVRGCSSCCRRSSITVRRGRQPRGYESAGIYQPAFPDAGIAADQ
jgi:hypothetical protein